MNKLIKTFAILATLGTTACETHSSIAPETAKPIVSAAPVTNTCKDISDKLGMVLSGKTCETENPSWTPASLERHVELKKGTDAITKTFIPQRFQELLAIINPQEKLTPEQISIKYLENLAGNNKVKIPHEIAEKIVRSTVNVMTSDTGFGTGWFVDVGTEHGIIITNKHVVALKQKGQTNTPRKEIVARGINGEYYSIEKVLLDPIHDIAILVTKEKPKSSLPLAGNNETNDDNVISLGFGKNLLETMETNTRPLHLQRGTKESSGGLWNNLHRYQLTNNPGDSGGPIINSFGNVVGIQTKVTASQTQKGGGDITFMLRETTNSRAESQNNIAEFLAQQGYTATPSNNDQSITFEKK